MKEIKYIIAKKHGRLYHKKSDWLNHDTIARDNGFDNYNQVIETGLLIEGRTVIIECKDIKHRQKRIDRTSIDKAYLKARELKSIYSYGYIKQGD
jgi:hypothetical protein